MLTFLFWNIAGNPIPELVAKAAHAHSVDVLVLAESRIPPASLLHLLNRDSADYQLPFAACRRIQAFTRFHSDFLRASTETNWLSIRRLNLPGHPELLLVMAHLQSGLYSSTESRSFECIELSRMIRAEEQKVGHDRTVLIGDFNLNPFDDGLASANGLNAVMTKELASRGERTVQQARYPFFYNPMWGYFGDRHGSPAGSYYYERAEHVMYFWNLFDQVLIRPSLIERFLGDELKILTSVSGINLMDSRGRPNKIAGSDHLPLLFTLNLA